MILEYMEKEMFRPIELLLELIQLISCNILFIGDEESAWTDHVLIRKKDYVFGSVKCIYYIDTLIKSTLNIELVDSY